MLNYDVRVFSGIKIVLICRRDTPRLATAIHCLLREARGRLDAFKTAIHPKPDRVQSWEKRIARVLAAWEWKNLGAVENQAT